MSDTIPNVEISEDVYVDVNTLASLSAGTSMVLENKSTVRVRLQIAVGQPAADSIDGEVLYEGGHLNSIKVVTAGENTLWAKSFGKVKAILSVQENV